MSTVIYYFSATGNSLAVAKKLQPQLPDCKLLPVAASRTQPDIPVDCETLGLIFPLYYLGMPLIVEDFVRKLRFKSTPFVFTIVTRGNKLAGGALTQLNKALQAENSRLNAGYYITLPDNYTPLLNLPDTAAQQKQFQQSEAEITRIAQQIKARTQSIAGAPFSIFSGVMHPSWAKRVKRADSHFRLDTTSCNGCGICAQICPANNVQLDPASHPTWQHQCEECLACLHACPQKAIQNRNSHKRPQYRHPEVTVAELIAQKKL